MTRENVFKHHLPQALKILVRDATWERIFEGLSGAYVFRLENGPRRCYLKIAPMDFQNNLLPEKERLVWLQGKLPVPEVLGFDDDGENHYLLISEMPGVATHERQFEDEQNRLIPALAEGLRLMHSVDIRDCPFDARLNSKIKEARTRLNNGWIDADDFDDERQGRTAQSAFDELLRTRPKSEDLVFTHGDYCLPNIFIDPQAWKITGFIDWGRAGIADRYQDLALAARSLVYNLGPTGVDQLFREYGLDAVDHEKIAFYKLLDEFF
jgi:aminoglycoside phosphotransferase